MPKGSRVSLLLQVAATSEEALVLQYLKERGPSGRAELLAALNHCFKPLALLQAGHNPEEVQRAVRKSEVELLVMAQRFRLLCGLPANLPIPPAEPVSEEQSHAIEEDPSIDQRTMLRSLNMFG